jgi:hypothetical protein
MHIYFACAPPSISPGTKERTEAKKKESLINPLSRKGKKPVLI